MAGAGFSKDAMRSLCRWCFLLCGILLTGMSVLPAVSRAEPIASLETYYDSLPVACADTDECVVKNVGNCCGMLPRCVHRDAKPDLDGVRAYCEKQGIVSICGFQPIEACQCIEEVCRALPSSAPPIQ